MNFVWLFMGERIDDVVVVFLENDFVVWLFLGDGICIFVGEEEFIVWVFEVVGVLC